MIPSQNKGVRSLNWVFAEAADKWLPPSVLSNLNEFLQKPHQGLIKESPVRTAIIIPGPKGDLFLKRYKIRGLKEGLKYCVFPSKARREWQMARLALHRGIPTPLPLAMAERHQRGILREAFLITQAIVPAYTLDEIIFKGAQKDFLLRAVSLIRKIHEAGIFHQDLHAGNILVQQEEGKLYLIDLHRSKSLRRISERRRLLNFAQFFYSVRGSLTHGAKEEFLRLYEEEGEIFSEGGVTRILRKIEMLEDRIHRRHMKSRTKRCLKNSGGFYVAKKDGWRIWARRGLSQEALIDVIQEHKAILAKDRNGLIKDDRRSAISLFEFMKARICVKEYRYPGFLLRLKELFRTSKALKGWLRGNGLVVRGFAGITPLALLERRRWRLPQETFLIMESPPEYMECRKYVKKIFKESRHSVDKKRAFIKEFATFMSKLYHQKISHRDLKVSNILVKEDGNRWSFALTDWEDLELDQVAREKRLIKELVQLNTSIPYVFNVRERLMFVGAYFTLIERGDARDACRKVMKESLRRGWTIAI